MKEVDRKKVPKNNQRKVSAKPEKQDQNPQHKSDRKALKKAEKTEVKASSVKGDSGILVSDSNTGTESSEVYENMVIDYVDDVHRSEEASAGIKSLQMSEKDANAKLSDHSLDMENEPTEEESDTDTITDSVSSQGDLAAVDDEKVERASRVPRVPAKSDSSCGSGNSQFERVKSDKRADNIRTKASKSTPKKPINLNKEPSKGAGKDTSDDLTNMKVHPKPLSDSSGVVDKSVEEAKDADVQDGASLSGNSVGSDDETVSAEENGEKEDNAASVQKIQEMESRIEKLEEELREVAALEVALYSVVPEHGSSAHKVHTPARRLCRLYIHACKHWSLNKRATVARNTVSGLVLIAKSCGHDVPRLSFWLSNAVVLREIISQTFASSCQSSPLSKIFESSGGKNSEAKLSSSLRWKANSGSKQPNKQGLIQVVDDWQETRTFTAALEKVESWIFSRIVESIWWQTLTPHMQSPSDDKSNSKVLGRILGTNLGDQQQGNFSINLWKNAFEDALRRLCPVRAGYHECGCLPVLARKVMEQCLARLDVAMFNAILRESAHEIPTDPVSDPIVDSRVLPIPAGDLSFGSGAQLKNSIGNWSRCLTDLFGMGAGDMIKDNQNSGEEDGQGSGDEPKCFHLLGALSDLLMLPKDMLMDQTIRMEVCPQISLQLVKRILCNFTPDEFCPDPVPGSVLEALNAECIIERRLSGNSASSFPYAAALAVYTPPSSADVAEKVAEAGGKSQLSRSASAIQRKGYTSDEDLVELDCPLATIVDKSPSSPTNPPNGIGSGNQKHEKETADDVGANARYELLREVWQAT